MTNEIRKNLKFDDDALEKLEAGVKKVADAVRITLGPRGHNVLYKPELPANAKPTITNDGVTIAKQIKLSDPFEDMGAQLLIEVASKTNDIAGDGTTTATILAHAMFTEGVKALKAGANPMGLKRGIQRAIKEVVAKLKEAAKPISTKDEIEQVATISANNDAEIGKLISAAMEKVGKDGVITIEETKSVETTLEVKKGIQFDKGYQSPYFCTNKTQRKVEYDNPYILFTDKSINDISTIINIMERAIGSKKPLLIIADDITGEALNVLVANKLRGNIPVVAVRAPGFGLDMAGSLEDMATATGGKVISDSSGKDLEEADITDLGTCKKIIVTENTTTLIEGDGDKETVTKRIEQLKESVSTIEKDYDREKMLSRVAKLSSGVAVLKVGAQTETELKEKVHRVEDALQATRAAVAEGIVPGGGVALIKESGTPIDDCDDDKDVEGGRLLVYKAMKAPFRQLLINAGYTKEKTEEIGLKIFAGIIKGFNVQTLYPGDLVLEGVIDPAKVVRSAVENAGSVASMLLTTGALISIDEADEDKKRRGLK